MMWMVIKTVLSGFIIAFASSLAGKKPVLAGFIIALPLMSMLSIFFSYWQYRDMEKINEFALSILVAVPLSLSFFIPFLLNRWLHLNFALTYALGISCLGLAYGLHSLFLKG